MATDKLRHTHLPCMGVHKCSSYHKAIVVVIRRACCIKKIHNEYIRFPYLGFQTNFHFFQCPILVRDNIWDQSDGSTFSLLVGSTCEATQTQANGNGYAMVELIQTQLYLTTCVCAKSGVPHNSPASLLQLICFSKYIFDVEN